MPALLSAEMGSSRKPFFWWSWTEGLLPALWLPQADPKPSPNPSNLFSMADWLTRETQPLLGRNMPLTCMYLATPQKSVAELERLVSLTLTSSSFSQSL